MFRKCGVTLAVVCCAAGPVGAGGGGPVAITGVHGWVQIREIDFQTGRPKGRWQPAKAAGLIGTYQVRTGRGSWAHLTTPFRIRERGQWRYPKGACVDSGSVVRIDSYADSTLRVMRGRVSKVDGKRVGRLPRVMGEG